MSSSKSSLQKRRARVRRKLRRNENTRPRLSVHRSGKNIYAQLINDQEGVTLAAASTLDKELRGKLKSGSNKSAATEVGRLIAQRCKAAGIEEVVFDRGAYPYHGRVKALAEAAREGGLKF